MAKIGVDFKLDCNMIDQTHGKFVQELTLVFTPLSKFEIY